MPEPSSVLSILRRSFFLWFGGLFLVVGPVLLVIGIQEALQEQQFQRQGAVARAVVVAKSIRRTERGGDSSTTYEVRYRFTAADGQEVEGTAVVSVEAWEQLEDGSPLQVRYLPQAPQSNRLAGASQWDSAVVSLVLGGIFAPIGGVLFIRSLRRVWRELRLRREGVAAEGTVLQVRRSNVAINKVTQWQIRYRYRDHVGRTHEGESDLLAPEEADAWSVGHTAEIRYDRQHPEESVWVGGEPHQGVVREQADDDRSTAETRKPGLLKRSLPWVGMLAIVFLAVIVGEAFPPLKGLERFLKAHQFPFLAATIGLTAVGFVLMMGGILDLIMAQGAPMSHEEVEELHRETRDLAARPYIRRASMYRIWGKTAGAQAHDEFSLHAMKEAWRTGAWWRHAQWRRRFVTTAGGLLLLCGVLSVVIVLAPAGLKLLIGGALLYALGRLARSLRNT